MLFRIDANPNRATAWTLSWFLFAAGIALYFYAAHNRHSENPDDRVVPGLRQLGQGLTDAVLKPDSEQEAPDDQATMPLARKFFTSMLWTDTVASAKRFVWAMLLLI